MLSPPGRMAMSTPHKPMPIAIQCARRAGSFNKGTASAVTTSGEMKNKV